MRWKISGLGFLGSNRHSSLSLSLNGSKYQRGVVLISAGVIEGNFEGKISQEGHQGSLFLHENVLAHRVIATQKKLVYLGFQRLDHTPYSPDLDPSDYHVFPGLKNN